MTHESPRRRSVLFSFPIVTIRNLYIFLQLTKTLCFFCLLYIVLNLIHKLFSLLLVNALSKVAFTYYFPKNEETFVHHYLKKQYFKFLFIIELFLILSHFFIFKIASLILRNLNNLHFQSWLCVKNIVNRAFKITTVFRLVDTLEESFQKSFLSFKKKWPKKKALK